MKLMGLVSDDYFSQKTRKLRRYPQKLFIFSASFREISANFSERKNFTQKPRGNPQKHFFSATCAELVEASVKFPARNFYG